MELRKLGNTDFEITPVGLGAWAIADIVYTYKLGDIRTSENEITRIGVNFIIDDYRENGENSVLHRVLKALNS